MPACKCALASYGNTNPERAFTAEISDALIAPDAFTSNLKLLALLVCPERALTPLMSLAVTDRVLFTSPTRKPIDTVGLSVPLTPVSVRVARLLSASVWIVTVTSLGADAVDALTGALAPSTTATLPAAVMAVLKRKTMV